MRIRDWSSDVCSSDLRQQGLLRNAGYRAGLHVELHLLVHQNIHRGGRGAQLLEVTGLHHAQGPGAREVGEEEVVLHEVMQEGVARQAAVAEAAHEVMPRVDRKSTRLNSSH